MTAVRSTGAPWPSRPGPAAPAGPVGPGRLIAAAVVLLAVLAGCDNQPQHTCATPTTADAGWSFRCEVNR